MSTANTPYRFVSFNEAVIEEVPPGKVHHWYCNPQMVPGANLLFVRARLLPGEAHRFHHHPYMEEVLYILSGTCEQWVEDRSRTMGPGDSVYLRAGLVHGTYNTGPDVLDFLAVLSPADNPGPVTVEVAEQEPWRSLRR